jgi:hypothetical protein
MNEMRARLLDGVVNLASWGARLDAELLRELIDVADGLKQRCESVGNDNTELMQRARRLLDKE